MGVGNSLMGDDGVGIAVLALLKNETLPENVCIIDIGMSSLSLLHALTELDAAIIVDAVDFGARQVKNDVLVQKI
ncbi:MAG: hydrogenase maturation protease [Actinomycetota bacterium]|nr:hydrogenase maturation protease [Actinomycetota bacterium]